MKVLTIWMLFTLLAGYCIGQKLPEATASQVVCRDGVYEIKAQLAENDHKTIKPTNELFYSWYARGVIHTTQGGFDGPLLHGYYSKYYKGHQLKEKGQYNFGLKDGTWLSWEEDGSLISVVQYKMGMRQGKFKNYDKAGIISETGKYKLDRKEGNVITYAAGRRLNKNRYKRGQMVIREKRSIFSFLRSKKAKDAL